MIKSRFLFFFSSFLFLFSCDEGIKDRTLIFIPGVSWSGSVYIKDVWGKQGLENTQKQIDEYLKNAPQGFKVKERAFELDIEWNPPVSLSGEVFSLGTYRLEVAAVEPIKTKIDGSKIILIDDACFFSDKEGKFELNLYKGGIEKLKNVHAYKVISELSADERRIISDEYIKRQSCVFTANLQMFMSGSSRNIYEYKYKLPRGLTLFGASAHSFYLDYPDKWPRDQNWLRLDYNYPLLNNKSASGGNHYDNLFFIGNAKR